MPHTDDLRPVLLNEVCQTYITERTPEQAIRDLSHMSTVYAVDNALLIEYATLRRRMDTIIHQIQNGPQFDLTLALVACDHN